MNLPLPGLADYLREHGITEGSMESIYVCRAWVAAVSAERATQADALHVAYSQGVADGRDAERERCAKLCETASYRERWMRAGTNGTAIEPCRFAAAIRELGQ